jgi:hypothetical protein
MVRQAAARPAQPSASRAAREHEPFQTRNSASYTKLDSDSRKARRKRPKLAPVLAPLRLSLIAVPLLASACGNDGVIVNNGAYVDNMDGLFSALFQLAQ